MDERRCGNCEFFSPELWRVAWGWGKCESTGRVTHESTPCSDCVNFVEDEVECNDD